MNIFGAKTIFKLAAQEPDVLSQNQTVEEWQGKDLNDCILGDDLECNWKFGALKDFSVVRPLQRKINLSKC